MYCSNCGNKIEEDAKFCFECGSKTKTEIIEEVDILEYPDINIDPEIVSDPEISKSDKKDKNLTRKILSGLGVGGAMIGGGLLYLVFTVLRFLYIALSGLSIVWLAIVLFNKGSIILGLIVLIIGTPIAIGIASYLFMPLFILSIITLIIWGSISIFGTNVSFGDVWVWLWFIIKILIVGFMAYTGISEFSKSIKEKRIKNFFKENWFYIPLFFFLLWLFF